MRNYEGNTHIQSTWSHFLLKTSLFKGYPNHDFCQKSCIQNLFLLKFTWVGLVGGCCWHSFPSLFHSFSFPVTFLYPSSVSVPMTSTCLCSCPIWPGGLVLFLSLSCLPVLSSFPLVTFHMLSLSYCNSAVPHWSNQPHQVQAFLIQSHPWPLLGPVLLPLEQPPLQIFFFLSWNPDSCQGPRGSHRMQTTPGRPLGCEEPTRSALGFFVHSNGIRGQENWALWRGWLGVPPWITLANGLAQVPAVAAGL